MTATWLLAALGLACGLAIAGVALAIGRVTERLVAFEVVTSVGACLVVVLAAGLDEPSYMDLALAFVLLGTVGTLTFARFLERWL